MNPTVLEIAAWVYKKALAYLTQPAGGVGFIYEFPVGNGVEEERMANVARLQQLCTEAVSNPAFVPKFGKTFCNFCARYIAEGMGFFGFPANAMANDMIGFLATRPEWREDSIERAHAHAIRGGLAFLTLTEYPHGHIAAVYPAPMESSGSWGEDVPLLANVGATNGIMRASAVFRADSRPMLRAFLFGETA